MREEKINFEDAMAIVAQHFGLTLEVGKDLTLTAQEREALQRRQDRP